MGIRDLLVLAVIVISLPISLLRPFYGLCVFTAFAYARPQDFSWVVGSWRLSYPIALLTLIGALLNGERLIPRGRLNLLMGLLWVQVTIAVLLGIDRDQSMNIYTDFTKMLIIAFLSSAMLQGNERRILILTATIAGALAFHGTKGGLWSLVNGFAKILRGPGGLLDDNNNYALGLGMAIPLVWQFGRTQPTRLRSWTLYGVAFLMAVCVAATGSRGGALALGSGVLAMVLSEKYRVRLLAVMGVLALVIGGLASQSYLERLSTISEYEQDESAMGRIEAWTEALRIFSERPLTGVGLDNFRTQYAIDVPDREQHLVTHNTYFQLLADAGLPAMLLLLALLGTGFLSATRIARDSPSDQLRYMAIGIRASIVTFAVGAVFLNRAFFDLPYQLYAILAAAELYVAERGPGGPAEDPAEDPAEAADGSESPAESTETPPTITV